MMNSELTSNAPAGQLHIQGEMTIYRAHEVAEALFTAVRAHDGDVSLDLSAVSELDTAGLQLILMARRLAEANGHCLSIVQPSECVREVLTLCNVATEMSRQAQDAR
jgi:anti-sigma B factor antagonist